MALVYQTPRFAPAGDAALLVEIGDRIGPEINARVHALDRALAAARLAGVVETIPAYRSLLVCFDPVRVTRVALEEAIVRLAAALRRSPAMARRIVRIPTCYGGTFGPDLPDVASHCGLTPDEVIALHAGGRYRVAMMGFSPGFAYLEGMDPRLATPRLLTPRTSIPAGSVGIAQRQTGIYPTASPGGWQLIGRTPVNLFDPAASPPTALEPGDEVRFQAIDEQAFDEIARPVAAGHDGPDEGSTTSPVPAGPRRLRQARRQTPPANGRERPSAGNTSVDAIEVLEDAPLATVQDLGRHGYQRYGIPVSGAMDPVALRIANLLVGNDEGLAGVELTLGGPPLRFLVDSVVAVTGADLRAAVDDVLFPAWEAVAVTRGSILTFRGRKAGARAYLAIAGGIAVPVVLGSRSTFVRSRLGGLDGRGLRAADRLPVPVEPGTVRGRRIPGARPPAPATRLTLRTIPGPHTAAFTSESLARFYSSSYAISPRSDRMGYRLEGPRLTHAAGADIVSEGTPSGTVQVTGDGLPIVLLADRGTAGGYTKIATVISADTPRLGQMAAGDDVRFTAVTEAEAGRALREQEARISSVARTAPRVFRRRVCSLVTAAGELRALGGFEEVTGEERAGAPSGPPIEVVVEGVTWRVNQRWAKDGPAREKTDATWVERRPAIRGDEAGDQRGAGGEPAAAAVNTAAAIASEPKPRDFPLVI